MFEHFRRWGALYILAALFLISFALHFHFQVLIEKQSMAEFFAAVFENWQSEWIQLFVQALLLNALAHILYEKEKEDEERIEAKIDKLAALVNRLATERETST